MTIHAPAHWSCVDFISDMHLQESEPATFAAWRDYMRSTSAQAVFILGDLFEVWLGDDALVNGSVFERQCVDILCEAASRLAVFIMQGNRDFLMGHRMMEACGATLLDDPTLLVFADQSWLLTHGDALCLDDHAYQAFRATVRTAEWQQDFLSKPFSERQTLARGMRQTSELRKHQGEAYADVDADAALEWMARHGAATMVHGHTHRPGEHALGANQRRIVLSDWDLSAEPARAEVLRLQRTADVGAQILRRSPTDCCKPG